jgi:hypothetical protein
MALESLVFLQLGPAIQNRGKLGPLVLACATLLGSQRGVWHGWNLAGDSEQFAIQP